MKWRIQKRKVFGSGSTDEKEEQDQKDDKDTITSSSASSGDESNGTLQDLCAHQEEFHISRSSSRNRNTCNNLKE